MSSSVAFAGRYLCPACLNPVLNNETNHNPVGCDGQCQRWFHRQCVGLTRIQYAGIIEHNDEWICGACNAQSAAIVERISREPTPQPELPNMSIHATNNTVYPSFHAARDQQQGAGLVRRRLLVQRLRPRQDRQRRTARHKSRRSSSSRKNLAARCSCRSFALASCSGVRFELRRCGR